MSRTAKILTAVGAAVVLVIVAAVIVVVVVTQNAARDARVAACDRYQGFDYFACVEDARR